MEKNTIKIDQSVRDWFKSKYAGLNVKRPRFAILGVSDEFRKMEVGEVVLFPVSKYKANSIRATPSTTLLDKKLEGWSWVTRVDPDNKSMAVLRLS